jgi:predicted nucleic acid-binding protein
VASALRRIEAEGRLSPQRAAQAFEDLITASIRRLPTLPLMRGAWAMRDNVSPYDALYVALARALECPLLTADRRLAAAPGLGVPTIVV